MTTQIDASVMIDKSREITAVTQPDVFGYTREELIGKPIELLVPDDEKDEHEGKVDAFLDQFSPIRQMGGGHSGMGRMIGFRHKNGTTVPANIAIMRVVDGDPVGIAWVSCLQED